MIRLQGKAVRSWVARRAATVGGGRLEAGVDDEDVLWPHEPPSPPGRRVEVRVGVDVPCGLIRIIIVNRVGAGPSGASPAGAAGSRSP